MKRQLLLASILVTVLAMPVFGQLAPPNPMGVAIGHMHLNVSDVNVQQKFWTDVGGKIVNREKIVMAQFPGIYVLIRKQDYNGGSVGSVIDHFGATAGKRAQFDTANVPGTEITFTKVDMPQAPTKGRSVDHMGFEVKNIDAFVAKLQAAGIKTDGAIRNSTNAAGLRIVYVTDPWGTEIEITEGLRPQS